MELIKWSKTVQNYIPLPLLSFPNVWGIFKYLVQERDLHNLCNSLLENGPKLNHSGFGAEIANNSFIKKISINILARKE